MHAPADPPSRPANRHGCLTSALWVFVAALITTLLSAGVVIFLTHRINSEVQALASRTADRFQEVFNVRPEIRVDGLVILESTKPVLEIATAEKQLLVRYQWSQSWLYSTKNLEIEAPFTAKAGYKLEEPFRLRIDPHSRVISADLPKPEILSVEMGELKILRDEDGFWNKITPEDRQAAINELRILARRQFEESNLIQQAAVEARKRLDYVMEPERASRIPTPPPLP